MAMVVMEAALNVGRLDSSEVPHLRERKKAYLQINPFKNSSTMLLLVSLSLSLSLSSVSICCVSRFSKALNFFRFFFSFSSPLSLFKLIGDVAANARSQLETEEE